MIRNARIVDGSSGSEVDGRPMEEGNVFDDTLESLNVNFVVGTCLLRFITEHSAAASFVCCVPTYITKYALYIL